MLTQCPACSAIYRVRQAQLAVAGGLVTCGQCDHIFDTQGRLIEEPTPPAPGARRIPAVLKADLSRLGRAAPPRPSRAWYFVAVLAAGVLLLQTGWLLRGHWYGRHLATDKLIQQLCRRFACEDALPRREGRFTLLAREVRAHPERHDVLIVRARFVNRAAQTADYPLVQLRLEDHMGTLVGIRRFRPREYLTPETDPSTGMPPNASAELMIEVVTAQAHAENFEITFL